MWTIVAAKQTRAEIRVNSVTFFLASSSQYFHHNGWNTTTQDITELLYQITWFEIKINCIATKMNEQEIILYLLQMLIDWKTQSTFLSYKDMSAQVVSVESHRWGLPSLMLKEWYGLMRSHICMSSVKGGKTVSDGMPCCREHQTMFFS